MGFPSRRWLSFAPPAGSWQVNSSRNPCLYCKAGRGIYRSNAMKAIRVEEFGEPEVMRLVELPDLKASDGEIARPHSRGRGQSRGDVYPCGRLPPKAAIALYSRQRWRRSRCGNWSRCAWRQSGRAGVSFGLDFGNVCGVCPLRAGSGTSSSGGCNLRPGRCDWRALCHGLSGFVSPRRSARGRDRARSWG